ncbi:arginine/serine-rich splicing factor [Aspergillus luchuensis]|uniref:Arginine/serine-rich splicing factor n=1 Tax=Aspergillus kawachii TaxID=1069201 RepID=A0A146F581_ASPKA|nr:arginine/serine-rich splicing factor [Aspergillus luchuensis]
MRGRIGERAANGSRRERDPPGRHPTLESDLSRRAYHRLTCWTAWRAGKQQRSDNALGLLWDGAPWLRGTIRGSSLFVPPPRPGPESPGGTDRQSGDEARSTSVQD